VKRKKAPAGTASRGPQQQQQQGDEGGEAEAGATAAGGEGSDVDVLAVGAADETPESWGRLLAGLSEICAGIGMALQNELCEWGCGWLYGYPRHGSCVHTVVV
jgi:hypothetical protein